MPRLLRFILLFVTVPALAKTVVFVDNSRPPGGEGSAAAPFATISAAVASRADVVVVAETAAPYVESLTLQKGQMLVGSAYGVDALAAELKFEVDGPPVSARQGAGPLIRGTVAVTGDNVVAGCTFLVDGASSGVTAAGAEGTLTLRNVFFKTTRRGYAVFLQAHQGQVSIVGGGIEASAEGSGIAIVGGYGPVTIERFPIKGAFGTVVRVSDRPFGAVLFRNGSSIHADDASEDAIVISNTTGNAWVRFTDRLQIRGRRRGLVASKATGVAVTGGDSWVTTTGASALDLRDSGADVTFNAVSAEGAAEGVVIDKVHGRVEVKGTNGEAGSGGVIHGAKSYGVRIAQSANIRLANMTISASGANGAGKVKGAKCAGDFDANSTAPCNAALYLRHLETSSFENILVDGGGAMGLNGNNLRDVKFENVEVRNAGDESFESGVLLQEVGGSVQFTRCRFTDNAGSEVLIEQRFKAGRVSFDRCVFAAAQRPSVAAQLIDVRASGAAGLEIELRGCELRENAGSGFRATASGTASLGITIAETFVQHLGTGAVALEARETSRARVTVNRSQITVPAVPAALELTTTGSASLCADVAGNRLSSSAAPIRMGASGSQSGLRIVSKAAAGSPASVLAAANGGAVASIDAPPAAVQIVTACP